MLRYAVVIISLGLLSCFQFPVELKDKRIADCSHATIPASYKPDSNTLCMVIEIYDFEQRLINYGENHEFLITYYYNTPVADIYWNGADSDGKPVDPGKYLVKESMISKRDTSCTCSEVIITK